MNDMACFREACRYNRNEHCISKTDYEICLHAIQEVLGISDECDFCGDISNGFPDWKFTPNDSGTVIDNTKISLCKTIGGNSLVFTNSADEHGYGWLSIKYCPRCGRRL